MTRSACLNAIYDLAKQDNRVVFIGSDLSANTLLDFRRDFPNRFFMEGVQEQNIIGMAAGLALEGFIPYVNTIATFLTRRCYEQIAIDICAHNLPVRLIGNGGGLVYAPLGLTHCATEDIAIMRALPNMSVAIPADNDEMKTFMPQTLNCIGPMYIRLGKDNDPILPYAEKMNYNFTSYPHILIISTGAMSHRCIETLKLLKDTAICDFKHIPQIKPLHIDINNIYRLIVVVEEGIRSGGLGTAVLEYMNDNKIHTPVLRLGLPDAFPDHYGEQEDLLETYRLTPEQIAERVKDVYARL